MSPKVFGCTICVHIPKYEEPNSPLVLLNVFLWDTGVNQKGYRCFDPSTKKIITIINCNFLETEFFYHLSSQGRQNPETNHGDCLSWFVSPLSPLNEEPTETVAVTAAEHALYWSLLNHLTINLN